MIGPLCLKLVLAALVAPSLLLAQDGFSPIVGGLPFDSGFALGLEYRKSQPIGLPLDFRAKGIGSIKKYEYFEAGVAAPRLAGGLLFAGAQVRYRNYPEEDFWGIGAKSSRDRRTTYRLEDLDFTGDFGVRPMTWLEIGASGGALNTNAGSGKDRDWPSIERRFLATEAPSLDRQPHYFHGGAFLCVDLRDESADPRRGGLYHFRWTAFRDRKFSHFHFQRSEVDIRQFFSSFRDSDTIAVRVLINLNERAAGRQIPFFMQPTVGGGGDLRGYQQYRFRDENAYVLNLEHRWRLREMLHLVGFADAGRVFSRPGQIGFSGMRGSAGVGGRIKLGDRILIGADFGWSPDGPRFWFRGAQTF